MTTRDIKPKLRIKLFPHNKKKKQTEINYATGQTKFKVQSLSSFQNFLTSTTLLSFLPYVKGENNEFRKK